MDALAAIAWVEENQYKIIGWLSNKLMFTPYGMDDFLQDANKIALVAANKIAAGEATEEFHLVFWQLFKEEVAAVVSCPIDEEQTIGELIEKAMVSGVDEDTARDTAHKRLKVMKDTERRKRSKSVPRNLSSTDAEDCFIEVLIDTESIYRSNAVAEFDMESAINAACSHLKDIEKSVLLMTIGHCEGGRHTQAEIGKKINRETRNVRAAQDRIFSKLKAARQNGLFNPDSFVRYRDPFEPQVGFA